MPLSKNAEDMLSTLYALYHKKISAGEDKKAAKVVEFGANELRSKFFPEWDQSVVDKTLSELNHNRFFDEVFVDWSFEFSDYGISYMASHFGQ